MESRAVRRQRLAVEHYERVGVRAAEAGHAAAAESWQRVVSAERMVLRRMEKVRS